MNRISILKAVKTPLGFFVLVVLAVEAALGALARRTAGSDLLQILGGMLVVILSLIAVVAFLAYTRPEALVAEAGQDGGLAGANARFCTSITGTWWQRLSDSSHLSYIELCRDSATGTVRMQASSYNEDGDIFANWESVAACVNSNTRTVFYLWKGWYAAAPNEQREGFGHMQFKESLNDGTGLFLDLDTNLSDPKRIVRRSVEFTRSTKAEAARMKQSDESRALVREKFQRRLSASA